HKRFISRMAACRRQLVYTASLAQESCVAITIHWIRDNAELARQCQAWRQQPFVALDTEFMRVDTFYPIAGLLQASTGEGAWLIDPLCIDDWTPLAALL